MSQLAAQTAALSLSDAAPAKPKKTKGAAPAPLAERPEFIEHRNRIFDELYEKQQQEIA
ncbi:hypothetical protein H4R21_005989, partial [Coemansia helicoidea]